MRTWFDLDSMLHHLVCCARDCVPGAERGSLSVRDGASLVYRASVGYEAGGAPGPRVAFDEAAVPELSPELWIVPGAAWRAAHAPGAADAGAAGVVLVSPIVIAGRIEGFINVEQPTGAGPEPGARSVLELVSAQAALVLERRGLHHKVLHAVQEVRLLAEVLQWIGPSTSPSDLIQIVGDEINSVAPSGRWGTSILALPDESRAQVDLHEVVGQPNSANTFWRSVRQGALACGQDLGIVVECVTGLERGEGGQAWLVDEGIRRRFDGIAVAPMSSSELEPVIQRARAEGIPLITFDTPPAEGSGALLYVGTDNFAAGRLAGEAMARLLPGGGIVATAGELLGATHVRQRMKGFHAALAGTRLRALPPLDGRLDAALSEALARSALKEHPEIAGAFGACAVNGPAWGAAAGDAGRTGQLKVVGFDIVPEMVQMLADGRVHATVAQHEYETGYRTVEILCRMATAGVEETLAALPETRFVDTGADLITLERTPWSLALAEYLAVMGARRRPDEAHRAAVAAAGRPLRFLVIWMGGGFVQRGTQRRSPLQPGSLVGQVLSTSRSRIVDTSTPASAAWPEVNDACRRGMRSIAAVPLIGHRAALGALLLEGEDPEGCAPPDLAFLERLAGVMASVIESGRLVAQLTERNQEMEAVQRRQEAMRSTIQELSSPVAPIAPGILVMPLVGTLDAARAGRFLETLLREIDARRASMVLIDITGVAVVDAAVAGSLLEAARAARLLGAEVVLVGVSAAVARTLMHLGVDLSGITTRTNLEGGFTYALARTGGRILSR